MGTQFFYDEEVTKDDNSRVRCQPRQVSVADNHGVPEIAIGPIGDSYDGEYATFNDWQQFEAFVKAVNSLHFRLKNAHE
ncbi:hypothetical protein [Shewanella sp.]|jgi:hypothetical protein|uniref:hypothetical protein n=1 Tax=Shewanella sp. TaxID=50422 RepID=UPI004047F56B